MAAINANGTGAASSASAPITPAAVPGAPTAVTGTAGNGSVAAGLDRAGTNGGSPITGYTRHPVHRHHRPDTAILTGSTGDQHTVTGLTNGTAYTFTVTATNADGTGAASSRVGADHPDAPCRGAPTAVTGTAGNGSVALGWTAPASNGGSPITGYTVTPFIGTTAQTATRDRLPTGDHLHGHGLTNGTAYTFTVTATNADGTGAASAPSSAVTPIGADRARRTDQRDRDGRQRARSP